MNMRGWLLARRLLLRPLDAGDGCLYARIYCDCVLMRHVAPPLDRAQAGASFAIALRQLEQLNGRGWWVLVERLSGQAVGLAGSVSESGSIELGIMLLAQSQRLGYASEALGLLIDHLRTQHPMTELRLRHASDNIAMARVAKALGFQALKCAGQWRLPAAQ